MKQQSLESDQLVPAELGSASARTLVLVLDQGAFHEDQAGEVPVPPDMPGVKGIYLGGCVAAGTGRISNGRKLENAHAHTGDEYRGWVCFQLPKYFYDPEYHWLRMHELAHIISGEGHTDKWRKVMQDLGQEIFPRYQPRRRKVQ